MSERDPNEKSKVVHVYDGIEEEDNELPRWWLTTFWGAIVFAVIYWGVYHIFGVADLPLAAYGAEVERRAGAGGEVTAELLENMLGVPTELAEGGELYKTHCAVCHGQKGEGVIGPNLTDDFWLHGGDSMDVFKSIKSGIPAAGMPEWGPPLGASNTRKVTVFVLSLRGTHAPGKEPQGEKWTAAAAEDEAQAEAETPEVEDVEPEAEAQAEPEEPDAE